MALVCTSAGCAGAHAGAPHQRAAARSSRAPQSRIGAGTVKVLTVFSPGDQPAYRKVWVYRPDVADTASVPVIYFLHGLPGSYRDLANDGGKQLLDQLIAERRIPPVVVAAPDGNSSVVSDPEWADSPAGTRLETFVTEQLRAAVEGAHPRDRQNRAIFGFSMGGYGAMNIALHNPALYGAIASVAGYFHPDDESNIFLGDPRQLRANSPDHQLQAAPALRIFLADAAGDTEPVTRGETQRFASLLEAHGLHPVVDVAPGAHSAAYLRAELPRVLEFLLG